MYVIVIRADPTVLTLTQNKNSNTRVNTYFSCGEDMIREGDTYSPFAPCGRYPALVSISAGHSRLTFNTYEYIFNTALGTTLLAQNVLYCTDELFNSLFVGRSVNLQYWHL